MDVDTNHLLVLTEPDTRDRYERLPTDLNWAARSVLRGRSSAYVSRTSGGKLSRYAAKRRKSKRKTARAARKRNRR